MNSELLYITRKLGYPSSFGTRAGLGDFLDQYPDGIYAENGGGAPTGWESAAVWFGGDSERAASRFERMMSERNELSRLFRTRISGVLVLTFIYRLKSRMVTAIPIVGGQPQPIDQTWLNFYMPNGGTISLNKTGSSTVVELEYSLDGGSSWTVWPEDGSGNRSLTLAAGQTMHVRNTSETSTGFSISSSYYYHFSFTDDTSVGGNINSLLCKNPNDAIISNYCYSSLFSGCTNLTMSETFALPATTLENYCYSNMFRSCTNLTMSETFALPATTLKASCYSGMFSGCTNLMMSETFVLPATTLETSCYNSMFKGCTNVNLIRTNMTDISASRCLLNWLNGVSPTGNFHCPAELTISTGASGIPSGWTRHDI